MSCINAGNDHFFPPLLRNRSAKRIPLAVCSVLGKLTLHAREVIIVNIPVEIRRRMAGISQSKLTAKLFMS